MDRRRASRDFNKIRRQAGAIGAGWPICPNDPGNNGFFSKPP
jgi:hypothetical protein